MKVNNPEEKHEPSLVLAAPVFVPAQAVQAKPPAQHTTGSSAVVAAGRGGGRGGTADCCHCSTVLGRAGGGAPHSHPCTFVPNCSVILVMSRHNKPNLHNQWYRSIAKLLIFTKLSSFAPPVLLKTI